MGVKRIDLNLCNGCGICFEDCPTDVFRLDPSGGKAYVAYPRDCVECSLCEKLCPVRAISLSLESSQKLFFPY